MGFCEQCREKSSNAYRGMNLINHEKRKIKVLNHLFIECIIRATKKTDGF